MSRLGDIRAGVITNLGTALGANSFNHKDGYLLSPINPPCFEIDFPTDGYLYGPTFSRGTDTLEVIVRGVVQVGDTTEAQAQLDEWLAPSGATSVKAALEAERTLGGKVDDLYVVSVTAQRRVLDPSKPNALFLCAEWLVRLSLTP